MLSVRCSPSPIPHAPLNTEHFSFFILQNLEWLSKLVSGRVAAPWHQRKRITPPTRESYIVIRKSSNPPWVENAHSIYFWLWLNHFRRKNIFTTFPVEQCLRPVQFRRPAEIRSATLSLHRSGRSREEESGSKDSRIMPDEMLRAFSQPLILPRSAGA